MARWWVGLDSTERAAEFDSERAAIEFAHFDSQLESTTAVVVRHDDDGTSTVVATFLRKPYTSTRTSEDQ